MQENNATEGKKKRGNHKFLLQPENARATLAGGAALSSLLLFTSGCVVSSDEPSTEDQENEGSSNPSEHPGGESSDAEPVASTLTTTTDLGHELEISVYSLERLENDILKLNIGITNNSGENFSLFDGLNESEDEGTASQISLIDADNQKRHLSYNQSTGKCFCSPPESISLSQGDSTELWVAYPAPPLEVESMTVVTPLSPPIFDVPITTSSENLENDGLLEEEIIDLTMISDNLDDQTGRTESEDEVSILLSSDVLFDTNSADLSPEAEEILEQVAAEIDEASSTVVNIDGHADNTGSDSVNIPLSEERAESVESEISDLVTREEITFESEGHGSADPIAENDTEEGRERNRRVSVTFEK